MKTLIGAIALAIAAPVAAQTAPAADPHAGHAQHQKQGQSGHGEHKMDCCKDRKHKECCEKARQQGKKMECCAKHGGSQEGAQQGHSGH